MPRADRQRGPTGLVLPAPKPAAESELGPPHGQPNCADRYERVGDPDRDCWGSIGWSSTSAAWAAYMTLSLYASRRRIRENLASHGDVDRMANHLVAVVFSALIVVRSGGRVAIHVAIAPSSYRSHRPITTLSSQPIYFTNSCEGSRRTSATPTAEPCDCACAFAARQRAWRAALARTVRNRAGDHP